MSSKYESQILQVLRAAGRPLTTQEVAQALRTHLSTVRDRLADLGRTREVHRGGKRGTAFLWVLGPPPAEVSAKSTPSMDQVLVVLQQARRALTKREVATASGLHIVTATRAMNLLRDHNVIHLSGWRYGLSPTALYSFGPGKTAKRVPADRRAPVPRITAVRPPVVRTPVVRVEKPQHPLIDLQGAAFRTVLAPGAPWPYLAQTQSR